MKIGEIIQLLEAWAPPFLQESYDNCGLITGSPDWECSGILVSLDSTQDVILEAKSRGCNLVVSHHPILFKGIRKITDKTYVERALISSIKNEIAVYAIHTNLDNIYDGANFAMAEKLGLINTSVLLPKPSILRKMFVFVPQDHAERIRTAIFNAGGGHIGNYSECSFNATGTGTYKAGPGSNPYLGTIGERHSEAEIKVEVIFPAWLEHPILQAVRSAHPYEEPAIDFMSLSNESHLAGSGILGEFPEPLSENEFLALLSQRFDLQLIKHSTFLNKPIKKIALCGGAGSFLTGPAITAGADAFVTADIKYHEFFDAESKLLLADIGHWESEQYTIDLLIDFLTRKIPTFAVLKTGLKTNPVSYYFKD